jgi:hypothetical protein
VTLDDRPPRFVGQYTALGTVAAVLPKSFDIVVQLSEPGRVWYVVVPHLAPALGAAALGALGRAVQVDPIKTHVESDYGVSA